MTMRALLTAGTDEDAHIDARLRTEPVIWLATVRPDGRPRQVPVWFLWEDPVVLVFSGAGTQKLRNLRAEPRVSLSLDAADGGNDIVLLDGSGEVLEPGDLDAASVPGFVAKYEPRMGQTADEWSAGFPVPIRIVVSRVVAWSKPASGPRYRVAT